MALARALRGDDDHAIVHAREAYLTQVTNGPAGCDKPLMAAAMFHARRGDLPRAALIAGCVAGPTVRGNRHVCPMDERLDADVRALVSAGMAERERGSCQEAGARMTLAQVAGIAFDGAGIDGWVRAGGVAANKCEGGSAGARIRLVLMGAGRKSVSPSVVGSGAASVRCAVLSVSYPTRINSR